MKKAIVITSVFKPTEAVKKFAALDEYSLIVVGDKKTPDGWHWDGVHYLSVAEQEAMQYELARLLPYNHYCRKMLGYLKAIEGGAGVIVDTDDDNIPKEDWSFPAFDVRTDCIAGTEGFINIYQLFTTMKIWPRGLPLGLISKDFKLSNFIKASDTNVGIWQGLADEDPDVDAIYRLTSDEPCYFEKRLPVVLDKGIISPFNTQNTLIRKELFALMYLPTYVTFRYTDILRGLVAQPIMWLYNYQLGFTEATVVQKRNPHDYMKDFSSEIPMYETGADVVAIVSANISRGATIADNLYNAYTALLKNNIVKDKEMHTLEAWLKDIGQLYSNSA